VQADATPASHGSAESGFGAGRLFLADSRMAFLLLNHFRYLALRRFFGVSREQANALTFVLAVGAAGGAYEVGRRVVRAPLRVSGSDVAIGGFALGEAALGIAGPANRSTRGFAGLVALGLVGGLAVPGLTRTAHRLRATEQRLRRQRIGRYVAAGRAAHLQS
jgi:hypothetical protein